MKNITLFCLIAVLSISCKPQQERTIDSINKIKDNNPSKDSIIIKYVSLNILFTSQPIGYEKYKYTEDNSTLISKRIIKDSTEIENIKQIIKSLHNPDNSKKILNDVRAQMILTIDGQIDTIYYNQFYLDLDGDKFYKTPKELIQYIEE